MTVKEQVHELVEALDDTDARLTLRFLSRLTSRAPDTATPGILALDEDDATDSEDWLARGRPLTLDSPLWNIVGMADSGPEGPTDVSRNKHKYLADAYADLHEEE
jgi:hypothetical protein